MNTKRYYSRDIDKNTRTRTLLLVTLLAAAVLALDYFSLGFVRTQLWKVERVWHAASGSLVASVGVVGYVGSETTLVQENETLRAQVAQYQTLALSALQLKEENETLSKLVHLAQIQPGVTAPVASEESSTGIFIVGAGKREGVSVGDLVRAEDGYVLGKVLEVSATASVCRVVFAPNSATEALVGNTAVGMVGRGAGNGYGKAPRDADIAVGDVVTAAAYRGYPIGTVGHVESDAAGAYKEVFVRASRDVGSVRFVYIERP
ncbi:MAG: rod shape-determining protein MreC [Candidatus Parcubacteria bacterium]|jgi:cell shape-determining protein MreC